MIPLAAIALSLFSLLSIEIPTQRSRGPAPPPPARSTVPPRAERPAPFKIGETLTYDVSWSTYLTAGTAVTTVKEKKPSFNSTAYYVVAEGRPTTLLSKIYSVYYKLDSLIDTYTLLPQRGSVYSEEGKRHRFRITQFDRKTNKVHFEFQADGGKATDDFPVSPVAQDALSAIYVLRAVPFKAGERMTMPICDNGSNYRLQIDITGPEHVRSGLGSLSSLRLNLALFDAKNQRVGRNTALWMSDDARRLPVKLQADLAVGSFNLVLREAR